MVDACGRKIDHLRLSLTDYCNLSCRYCVPEAGQPDKHMINANFAVLAVIRWLSKRHGIRHLRLTGGEPLLHPKLVWLIENLSPVDTLDEITLTTNGQALDQQAGALASAGLTRVNISLDTLKPDRFKELTRGGKIDRTLSGIEAAIRAGLTPVKINIVTQRGLNDDELPDMAEWGLSRGCIVRFLEVMPIGPLSHVVHRHLVPASETLERLSERFELRAIPQTTGRPATEYAVTGRGLRGVIGIIAPMTRPFCSKCRRLRLTSRGWLVACLLDKSRFPLMCCWDGERLDINGADAVLHEAIAGKPAIGPQNQAITMLSLGG